MDLIALKHAAEAAAYQASYHAAMAKEADIEDVKALYVAAAEALAIYRSAVELRNLDDYLTSRG